MKLRAWIGSFVLLAVLAGVAYGLWQWKLRTMEQSAAMAAQMPEMMETVTVAIAEKREHRRTTTAIGTVLALQSITLRNELAGTVREVKLKPGQIVQPGDLLVRLDVSVEEAELRAQEAQATLAETVLERTRRMQTQNAAAGIEVERATAERDVARAHIARIKAIIDRKTIRAPFKARVGMVDLHVGQYLDEGTQLTTLQGIDDAVHIDFAVPQWVAAQLKAGDTVNVLLGSDARGVTASVMALDARIDPATRNAWVRARMEAAPGVPSPGASVRVQAPAGPVRIAAVVPVSALRKGPGGDHVFIVKNDDKGKPRARLRKVVSGSVLGDEVLILEGLEAGEQVAASGSFKLFDGALVAIAAPPAADVGAAR